MEDLKVPILSTRALESPNFGESPKFAFLARVRGRTCTLMHAYQHLWRSTSCLTQSYNSIEAGHAQCTALRIWRITIDQRGESTHSSSTHETKAWDTDSSSVWIGIFWWQPVGFFGQFGKKDSEAFYSETLFGHLFLNCRVWGRVLELTGRKLRTGAVG